jgi:hypothetical protein
MDKSSPDLFARLKTRAMHSRQANRSEQAVCHNVKQTYSHIHLQNPGIMEPMDECARR